MSKNYARRDIQAIAGYTPGEQPRMNRLIKLNTNENPYPPSPGVAAALAGLDWKALRRYPDPTALQLRQAAAQLLGVPEERIICGNGSDDLLTIALRTFVGAGESFAFPEPSYSLYPVLAQLQGAIPRPVQLDKDFGLPEDFAAQCADARLVIIARPNAPTGNAFPKEQVRRLASEVDCVLWIDEAYADFADDNCLDLVDEFPNVVVSRTFSKSYSLAGLRMGMAFAQEPLIFEMNKLKDSYNTDRIAQAVAMAALRDQRQLQLNTNRIRHTREDATRELRLHGCDVLPSQANFIFVRPAHKAAGQLFAELRERGLLVRYFALPRIDDRIRITIGTDEEMREFLDAWKELDQQPQ